MAYKVARSEAPPLRLHQATRFSFDPFATNRRRSRAWRQRRRRRSGCRPKCKVDVISARGVAPAINGFVDGAKRARIGLPGLWVSLSTFAPRYPPITPRRANRHHKTAWASCVVAAPSRADDRCPSFTAVVGVRGPSDAKSTVLRRLVYVSTPHRLVGVVKAPPAYPSESSTDRRMREEPYRGGPPVSSRLLPLDGARRSARSAAARASRGPSRP